MSSETKEEPIIEIAKELKEQIATQPEIESQVIVHITLMPNRFIQTLRIWNNTFLKCRESSAKCEMLFSENIAVYPQWTIVAPGLAHSFTLIFENLPKDCTSFDLIEDIPESGGFLFKNIERNNSNVYNLVLL